MQSGKSYAAAAGATTRKPQAASIKPSGNSNGVPASSKKKAAESKGKSNGKEAAAPAAAAPPGFATPKQTSTRGFSAQQQRVLRHRALFAFRFFVGKAVEVQLDDASVYAGVLDCIDPDDFSIVLKNTHRKSESGESFQSGSSVVFKRRQIAHLVADGVVNYNESAFGAATGAAASGFRTDTEISGRQLDHLVGRELQTASSWLDPQLDSGELEDPRRRSSKISWNQFEANEKLFGVVSSFDENIYTTKLDKSKLSTQQSRDAERIALEIERQASSNFHLQEERNHRVPGSSDDLDEEARYSSVDRKPTKAGPGAAAAGSKSAASYVPPALRNAPRQSSTGKPQAQSKPAPAAAATPATSVTSTPTTPKPLSFSDAVTGRTLASAAKPEQKKPANSAESKTETTKAAAAAPTAVSPEKKAPAAAATAPDAKTPDAKTPAAKAAAPTKEPKVKAPTAATADVPSPTKKTEKNEKADKADKADKATPTPAATPAPAKKTVLNPNAKEFKFNVAAAEFTPKFAPPPAVTSSPYRGAQQPHQHQQHHQVHQHQQHHQAHHHHHQAQHMGHMHHQPHPAAMAGGVVYSPMPDEWMYDGGVVGMDDPELLAPQGYMPYGVPMVPGAVMQPQMYPQMLPQRMMGGGAGGQRPHSGGGGGYGYQQPPYNPRGYYPPSAGVPGGMPYPGAVPVVAPAPQPPLPPREPSPSDGAPASSSATPASPALPPQQPPSSSAKAASAKK